MDTGRLVEPPFLHAAGPPPGSSLEAIISGFLFFYILLMFLASFSGSILDTFLLFVPSYFRTCFWGCFVLCLFMGFGTLNLQNDASYVGKTDSCLKLPLLKQIETSMISGSLFALLCHHFPCFPVINFCMFLGCFLL